MTKVAEGRDIIAEHIQIYNSLKERSDQIAAQPY